MTFSAENSTKQATNSSNNGAYRTNAKTENSKHLTKTECTTTTKKRSRKSNDKTIVNINNHDSVCLLSDCMKKVEENPLAWWTWTQTSQKFLCQKFNIPVVMQFSVSLPSEYLSLFRYAAISNFITVVSIRQWNGIFIQNLHSLEFCTILIRSMQSQSEFHSIEIECKLC